MNSRSFILPIYFLSGFTGLVYEIIWARQLALLFGVSAFAISAVLTVFMGGLGLGSFLAGTAVDKKKSPLKTYALLELGVGLYALFLPYGIRLMTPFYLLFHPLLGGNFLLVSLVRFVFSILLLILPCTLMGATFPVISRFFIREQESIGRDAGTLYSLNTLGAVCGCLFTGFYLMENLGISASLSLAAGINILLAAISYILSRWEPEGKWMETKPLREGKKPAKPVAQQGGNDRLILFLFGVSGFAALSLEVLWTRIFIFLLDNTVYAFTIILFTFLSGIAGGSFVFSRRRLNPKALVSTFGIMQAAIGLTGLLTLVLFSEHGSIAAFWNHISYQSFGGTQGNFWTGRIFASLLFSISLILPPTFVMGGTFPVVFRLCSPVLASAGRRLGVIYSINTLGSILGSFCAGFILLPWMGTQKGIIFTTTLSCISAFLLLRSGSRKSRAFAGVAVPYCLLLVLVGRAGDVPGEISRGKLDPGTEVLFYREGVTGTVMVASQENDLTPFRRPVKRIWINGDPIAGTFRNALQLEWLQAHIPLMLHPGPRETAVICFGTGSTAGAISRHPVREILAADTSRGVFQAASFFGEGNGNITHNKKFKAVVEDGRQFLATTRRRFDFITSEPPPPSNAGIVNLYAREFYEICKSRLNPGGMLSQWIPLHHLSTEDFRSLVATFFSVFPHSTMWYTKWDAIMVGSDRKITIDFARLKRRMKEGGIREDLREIGFENPYRLLAAFMMGEDGLRRYTAGAKIVTDDHPTVEFTAPRIHHRGVKIKGANLRALLTYREPVFPLLRNIPERAAFRKKLADFRASQLLFYEGRLYENDENLRKAAEKFQEALSRDPSFDNARYAFLRIHMRLAYFFLDQGKPSAGLQVVRECMDTDTDHAFTPQLINLRGLFHLSRKDFNAAARDFQRAMKLDPAFPEPYMNMASLYGDFLNEPQKAVSYFRKCLKLKITGEERRMIEGEIERLG